MMKSIFLFLFLVAVSCASKNFSARGVASELTGGNCESDSTITSKCDSSTRIYQKNPQTKN